MIDLIKTFFTNLALNNQPVEPNFHPKVVDKLMNPMKQAFLVRTLTGPYGTFGKWISDTGFTCATLERPMIGDHPCIPAGSYTCQIVDSPSHGLVYGVCDVPGRTHILIHPANWSSELRGCIALGKDITNVASPGGMSVLGVTSSRRTVGLMMADADNKPFMLTITSEIKGAA